MFSAQEIEDALVSNALLLFFGGFDPTSTGQGCQMIYIFSNQNSQFG
jgi:hypothetical protein